MNPSLLFLAAAFFNSAYADYNAQQRNSLLVTMRMEELLDIIMNCVSASRDAHVCQEFSRCESMLPPQIIRATWKCREAITGEPLSRCRPNEPMYTDPAIPTKIIECIIANDSVDTPEDKMNVVHYEICQRELYSRNCMLKRNKS